MLTSTLAHQIDKDKTRNALTVLAASETTQENTARKTGIVGDGAWHDRNQPRTSLHRTPHKNAAIELL